MTACPRDSRAKIGAPAEVMTYRVLVGFSGETHLSWLRCLRPGFRHCFAVVDIGGRWLLYDPASHQTRLQPVVAGGLAGVLRWLDASGVTVVCRRTAEAPRRTAPIRPYTCVEAVKRLLGIHAPRVHTPWQLYVHLTK